MGELVWALDGVVYLDANCFIYSVERIDPYWTVLDTLWQSVSSGQVKVVTSELTLLEVLVKPLKVRNTSWQRFTEPYYKLPLMYKCYQLRNLYWQRQQG